MSRPNVLGCAWDKNLYICRNGGKMTGEREDQNKWASFRTKSPL